MKNCPLIYLCLATLWPVLIYGFTQTAPPVVNTYEAPDTVTGNTTLFRSRTLTGTCSNLDAFTQDIQIGEQFCDITCPPPTATIQTPLESFTPAASQLFIHETCIVDNAAALNLSAPNPDDPIPPGNVFGRRLLWHKDVQGWDPVGRKLKSLAIPLAAGWLGMGVGAIAAGQSPVCGMSFGLFGCKKSDSGPQPTAAMVAQLEAAKQYAEAQLKWDANELVGLTLQEKINLGLTEVSKQNTEEIKQLQRIAASQQEGQNILASRIDNNAALVEQTFQQVYSDLIDGINTGVAYTDAKSQALEAQMKHNDQGIINITKAMANNISRNFVTNVRLHRENARDLQRVISGNRRQTKKVDVYRDITENVFRLVNQAADDGYTIFHHPLSPGLEPTPYASMLELDKMVYVDKMCINLVNTTLPNGAIARAHQVCFTIYASASEMLDNLGAEQKAEDFLDFLGPVGCVANATGDGVHIVDRCRAWMEVTHQECQPNLNFHWTDISSDPQVAYTRSSYQLRSSLCRNNPPTAGFWNGRKLDSFAEFMVMFQPMCAGALAQDVGNPHKFQVTSQRVAVWNIPKPLDPAICAMELDTILNSGLSYITLPGVFLGTLRVSFATLFTDQSEYERIRWGILPNWITIQAQEFRTLQDGRFYPCYRATFVATKTETEPTHTVVPNQPVASATIRCYNQPHICPGCPARVLLSTQTTSSLSAVIPALRFLPTSEDVIFGEWTPTGQVEILDTSRKLSTTSPYGPTRGHTFNYLSQPVPNGFDYPNAVTFPDVEGLDVWFDTYGPFFDHTLAAVSLQFARRELTPSGRCVALPGVRTNWVCDLRETWNVGFSTDMRSGILVLEAIEYTTTATFTIPEGEIKQRVYDGCAEMTVIPYSSQTIEIVTRNTLEEPLRLLRRRTSDITCPNLGDQVLTIPGKWEMRELVPACGNFTIQLFKYGKTGQLVPCSKVPIVVNITAATAGLSSPAFLGAFNTTIIDDKVGTGMLVLTQELIQIIYGVIAIVPIVVNSQLTELERSNQANATLNTFIDRIKDIQASLDLTSHSAVAELATVNVKVNQLQAQLTAQIAATDGALVALDASNADFAEYKANTTLLFAQLTASFNNYVEKTDDLIDALQASSSSNQCDTSLFASFANCSISESFTKIIVLVLFIGAMGLVVYFGVKLLPGICKSIGKTTDARKASKASRTPRRNSLGSYNSVAQTAATEVKDASTV